MMNKVISFVPDIVVLCGAAAVVYGVSMFHLPSAYIVGGLIASSAGLLGARRWVS